MGLFSSGTRKKKILVLTHSGADVDAIASAGAIYFALGKSNNVAIGVPEHISLPAKTFAESMRIPYSINPVVSGFDTIIMVDFNSAEMLGSMKHAVLSFSGKKIVIDHHEKPSVQFSGNVSRIIDASAVSCSLLVLEQLKKSSIPITPNIAKCAAAGIIVDSSQFAVADARAFSAMAFCLGKCKSSLPELLSLFRVKKDASQKIAALKAAKRARIFALGDYVGVCSEVGAFEADAAGALVRAGADIAFVGNSENQKLKISARANNFFLKKTGLDLAKIMQELSKSFDGQGGGHEGAAGFNGKGDFVQAGDKCIGIAFDFLKKKNPKVTMKEYK